LADTQTAVEYRFGRQKTVRIFGAHLVELIPCESCKGSGKLASMSGVLQPAKLVKGGSTLKAKRVTTSDINLAIAILFPVLMMLIGLLGYYFEKNNLWHWIGLW
jgi:uncharacterized membrane protein